VDLRGQYVEIEGGTYWKHPVEVVFDRSSLRKFILMDIDRKFEVGNSMLEQNKDHKDEWA
jgi:hypothetical protein